MATGDTTAINIIPNRLEIILMGHKNGKSEAQSPGLVSVDAVALGTAIAQVNTMHTQTLPAIEERIGKVEAWQSRYGNRWGMFVFGAVCGMNFLWDMAVRLYPVLLKLAHHFGILK
jgi:hypothetical protein